MFRYVDQNPIAFCDIYSHANYRYVKAYMCHAIFNHCVITSLGSYITSMIFCIIYSILMDHSGYGFSQWEPQLQCNIVGILSRLNAVQLDNVLQTTWQVRSRNFGIILLTKTSNISHMRARCGVFIVNFWEKYDCDVSKSYYIVLYCHQNDVTAILLFVQQCTG